MRKCTLHVTTHAHAVHHYYQTAEEAMRKSDVAEAACEQAEVLERVGEEGASQRVHTYNCTLHPHKHNMRACMHGNKRTFV